MEVNIGQKIKQAKWMITLEERLRGDQSGRENEAATAAAAEIDAAVAGDEDTEEGDESDEDAPKMWLSLRVYFYRRWFRASPPYSHKK
jgi:hypothetical protein